MDTDIEIDEYESLPTSNFRVHMMAGAAAGVFEHCVMYPVDSVKTRMQSIKPRPEARYRSVIHAFSRMFKYEGLLSPTKGVSAVVIGAGPAHALYFSCYEKFKRVFSGTEHGGKSPLSQMGAGAMATVLHDAIMAPTDVVKQRMQVYASPYRSIFHCAVDIKRREGLRAFYRSYTTQLAMNVPYQCIHFVIYEKMMDTFNEERKYNPAAHIFSGAAAGATASAVTTPFDVCKTLLNTQEVRESKSTALRGIVNAVRTIHQCCGWRGFFRGLPARVIYSMPSTALSWFAYETLKYLLSAEGGGGTEMNRDQAPELPTSGAAVSSSPATSSTSTSSSTMTTTTTLTPLSNLKPKILSKWDGAASPLPPPVEVNKSL